MNLRDPAEVRALLESLRGARVLVMGDLVADRYLFARPSRLSREAPVIVALHERETLIPGGAANAAANLLALGATVIPAGLVGRDPEGRALTEHFAEAGVDTRGILVVDELTTIAKTRVLLGETHRTKSQVLRLDKEPEGPVPTAARRRVESFVRSRLRDVDAILFSDYGYGVVDPAFANTVAARKRRPVLTVDSRYQIEAFRGLDLATPNEGELFGEDQIGPATEETFLKASRRLLRKMEAPALLVTQGNQGMTLFEGKKKPLHIATSGSEEAVDVSGAGDTVIAVLTAALAAGATPEVAARLANAAAGVTVMKLGAATCAPAELERALLGARS